MVIQYSDLNLLQKDYPVAVQLILDENQMQCPNAKFVRAMVGHNPLSEINDDCDLHLMVLFDLGTTDKLLWVWANGVDDPFIDEYYEIDSQDANSYLNLI